MIGLCGAADRLDCGRKHGDSKGYGGCSRPKRSDCPGGRRRIKVTMSARTPDFPILPPPIPLFRTFLSFYAPGGGGGGAFSQFPPLRLPFPGLKTVLAFWFFAVFASKAQFPLPDGSLRPHFAFFRSFWRGFVALGVSPLALGGCRA